MVSAGMTCVKYLLFCFNLLFAISGIAILTVGAIIHALYYHYSEFVDPRFVSAPLVLIVVGVVVFIVAFFGCCGAVRENHCMIITFSIFILVIFSLELAAGIAGYVRRDEVGVMLEDRLNSTMYDYYSNPQIQRSWDIMQHEMFCCGMRKPADWYNINHNSSLPNTCCPNLGKDETCTLQVDGSFKKPCLDALKEAFMRYGSLIGGVGIGIALVQLIGVVFACCLGRSIRKEYETV